MAGFTRRQWKAAEKILEGGEMFGGKLVEYFGV
jgi:hypothetical protein